MYPPELVNPYPSLVKINPPLKATNVSTRVLKQLKRMKPKKIYVEAHGYTADFYTAKPIIQVRSVLIKRLITGRYNRVIKLNHHIPDKGRHHLLLMPLSSRLISQLLYRRIKRPQIKNVIPQYNCALLFHKHLIVPTLTPIHALFVRLVPEKPNCNVLVLINLLPVVNVVKIYHLDHLNKKGTKPRFDIVTIPPLHMLVFVHFVDKDDPIVTFHIAMHRAKKERAEMLRRAYRELKRELMKVSILM